MFWFHILPQQITFWFLTALVILFTLFAPSIRLKRSKALILASVLAFVLFIPSYFVTTDLIHNFRFGLFAYLDHASVNDDHVQDFLPIDASNIIADKQEFAFMARFDIKKEELLNWLDAYWEKYGTDSTVTREAANGMVWNSDEEIARFFGHLKWSIPKDTLRFGSPRSGRGAGFQIWYSEELRMAWEYGNYW